MEPGASTPSNLGYAVLGLLARQESTGYELAQRLNRPVGYFWSARHSQIYPELRRLAGIGLVTFDETPGRGPRANKRYRITADGRRSLEEWVCGEHEQPPVRDLEVLRLWSVWTVAPEAARDIVRSLRTRHLAALDTYEAELAALAADPAAFEPSHPRFASRLTLEGGVRTRRAAVEWCEWMLTQWPTTPTTSS